MSAKFFRMLPTLLTPRSPIAFFRLRTFRAGILAISAFYFVSLNTACVPAPARATKEAAEIPAKPKSRAPNPVTGPKTGPKAGPKASPATPKSRAPNPATGPKTGSQAGSAIPGPSANARIEDERNTIEVFKIAAPATVFVTQNRVMRDFFGHRSQTVPAGSGTGFIWDKQGHIVTNAHVIGDEHSRGVARNAKFEVTLRDGKRYPARLVGLAQKKDLAVLKINAPGASLTTIHLPKAGEQLEVGQKTLAIGNPFGLDHTLTTGVISALNREVVGFGGVTIRNMIQTDASINPGNSGGPLLNSAGQLIGINTMIYSKSGGSAGIGFAVPIQTVRRLVPQLIRYGKPRLVGLGITVVEDRLARRLGIQGVIVHQAARRSPAALAGLRSLQQDPRTGSLYFDAIIAIDDQVIKNYDDLYNALEPHNPGDVVQVKVKRGPKILRVPVKLVVISDLDLR